MEVFLKDKLKTYFITKGIRKRSVGYCKMCNADLIKGDKIITLFCDAGIDDLNKIDPHCVGIFHEDCIII